MPASFPLLTGKYRDLAAAAAARLNLLDDSDPLRGFDAEIVIASGALRDAVAAALLDRWPSGVAGVRLDTLDALATRLLNSRGEFPRVASDAERRLAMRTAARAVDDPLLETRGIAAMLERSYRDVRDSGVTLAEFRQRGERQRLARGRLIYQVWSEYEKLIERIGAIDPADLFHRASAYAADAAPQIVAGFYDMTGVQLQFVSALAANGHIAAALVPGGEAEAYRFNAGFITRLASAGAAAGASAARLAIRSPRWSIAESERRDAEIRTVCAGIAAELTAGTPAAEIGIVARAIDPLDLALFERHARSAGFTLSRASAIPLTAHRLGRIVTTLLRLQSDNFPRSAVLELVRDGLRTKTALDVDAVDLETRRHRIAGGTAAEIRRRDVQNGAVRRYVDLLEEVEALAVSKEMRGSEWSAFLARVAERCTISTERDLAAADAIHDIAALFRRADAMRRRFEPQAIVDAIENGSVASFAEQQPSVWIGDVMQLRGRTFAHLFAVRMQDESFPQRRTDDPLLPDRERRALGVREIGDGRDEESLLFQLLFDSATSSLRFSFSGSDGFGKPLRPSQLLRNFAVEQMPEKKQLLLRDFGAAFRRHEAPLPPPAKPPARRSLQLVARAGRGDLSGGAFDGIIDDPELLTHFHSRLATVTPTNLEDFGECPQKFLFRHILDARELEEPERELQLDRREKGTLDHRILEIFYSSMSAGDFLDAAASLPLLNPEVTRRLEEIIDTEYARVGREQPPYNPNLRDIEHRATRRILRDFVVRDLGDLQGKGLRPWKFEFSFGQRRIERYGRADHPEAFVIGAGDASLRIEGMIDRIDRAPDGRIRVIDYKSGKALRHKDLAGKIDRGVRLQLALYAMAAAAFLDIAPPSVSGAIKPLAAPDDGPDKFEFSLGEKLDGLQSTLDTFARSIGRGLFPAFPDDDSCKYCPLNHSCRTRHDPEEKYAMTRWSEPRTLLADALARRSER